ncbi:MAG: hypothetical protein WBW98_02045 [Candidatus Sulfotelmatobacter sp.]|jgi:hypothetical protein
MSSKFAGGSPHEPRTGALQDMSPVLDRGKSFALELIIRTSDGVAVQTNCHLSRNRN